MKAYLAQIDGWSGSLATTVRIASHSDDRLCHLNGAQWTPAIAQLPTLRYDLFDGDFESKIVAPTGEIRVQVDSVPSLPALSLHDARIRIWWGELGAPWAGFSPLFDGRIKDQPAVTDGVAALSIGCDDSWLDELLLGTYAGTGNAEGSADLKGNVKPLAIGAPRFCTGTLIDATNWIYQLSSYLIEDIELAFDQLNRFGAPAADYPTFAALKAATIASGSWATCRAGGYVRLGAKPEGLVTFHVKGDKAGSRGWVRRPGSIIHRIAEIKGQLSRVNASSLDALDSACPWNLSRAVTAQTTARDLIVAIAQSVNAIPVMDWLGTLHVLPVTIGATGGTLAADGSSLPPVASVAQLTSSAPYWRVAQKAAVTQRVHTASEIAFDASIVPVGLYDAGTVYRQGNIVELADKSSWLYVNATPASGHAPPSWPTTSNAWWSNYSAPVSATTITYGDGTPLENLKPAEGGANKTETRTSAAISGQGSLATRNDLYFGSGYLLESAGGIIALLTAFKTLLGTASGFLGQGPWATYAMSIASLVNAGTNTFPYPRGVTDGRSATDLGWGNTGYIGMGSAAWLGGGYYVYDPPTGTGAHSNYPFYDIWIGEVTGQPFSVSMFGYGGGGSAFTPYFEMLDAARTVAYVTKTLTYNPTSDRWEGTAAAVSGGHWLRVVCRGDHPYNGSGDAHTVWTAIKVERNANCTPYQDDTSAIVSGNMVRWSTNVDLNALRPAEFGANITEIRSAAAIAGQGALATINDLFFGGSHLLESSGGAVATLTAFKTTLGIASGIAGQGALATISVITYTLFQANNGVDDDARVPGSFLTATSNTQVGIADLSSASPTYQLATSALTVKTVNDQVLISVAFNITVSTGSRTVYIKRVENGGPQTYVTTLQSVATGTGVFNIDFRDRNHGSGSVYYILEVQLSSGTFVRVENAMIEFSRSVAK